MSRETTAAGFKAYFYDPAGRVIRSDTVTANPVAPGEGQYVSEWIYNDTARTVTLVEGGIYRTTMQLNAWNEVTSKTDGAGNIFRQFYDGAGRLIRSLDAYNRETRYTWNALGKLSTIQYPDNTTETYAYNVHGQVSTITDSIGIRWSGTYDSLGRLISETGRPGIDKSYAYDALNRITAVYSGGELVESYTYTNRGRTVTMRDGNGGTYQYQKDPFAALQNETNRLGDTRTFAYDAEGRSTDLTQFSGKHVQTSYNDATGTTTTLYQDGSQTTLVRDYSGRIARATGSTGTITYHYDSGGRLTRQSDDKAGEESHYEYNAAGRRTRLSSGNRDIRYTYGSNGELLSVVDIGQRLQVSYTYDVMGRETTRRYGNGIVQETSYDSAGRVTLIREIAPNRELLRAEGYLYDTLGRRNYSVDERGRVTVYVYDSRSRLASVLYPWTAEKAEADKAEAEEARLHFTPDSGSPERYMLEAAAIEPLKALLDRMAPLRGNILAVANMQWRESFTYDHNGNRATKTTTWGTLVRLNRLETANERGWFQQQPEDISPAYSAYNRDYTGLSEVSVPLDDENIEVSFDYASRGIACDLGSEYGVNKLELQPLSATHRVREKDIAIYVKGSSVSPDVSETWVRLENWTMEKNALDGSLTIYFPEIVRTRYIKVTSIWDDRNAQNESIADYATFKNRVSSLLRVWTLTEARQESYAYDRNGNRLTQTINGQQVSYTYYTNDNRGNLPLIETDGQWRYYYDENGNRIRKESLSTSGETWSYSWDLHNRLINVTRGPDLSVSYAYDALNYRVRRDGKDGTTVYAYGRSGALTYQRNEETGLERSFVYLNNQIIGWTDTIEGVSTTYYAITDHLGSVTAITDSAGTILWQSEYLPFGNLAGAEGEVRFEGLYTGKDIDSETGLTYHWNRWRSEDGSTFISEDPAQDGMNWYGYCGMNPMNATDPTGLELKLINDFNVLKNMEALRMLAPGVKFSQDQDGNYTVRMPRRRTQGHDNGYALVEKIITSDSTVEINSSRYMKNYETGKSILISLFTDNSAYYNGANPDQSNGIGVDYGWVRLNAEDEERAPLFIILAHELIHAIHAIDGTLNNEKDEFGVKRKEEMRTIGDGFVQSGDITENAIRIENNLPVSSVERNYE